MLYICACATTMRNYVYIYIYMCDKTKEAIPSKSETVESHHVSSRTIDHVGVMDTAVMIWSTM